MSAICKQDIFVIILLISIILPLRFINLGYSEFIPDEKKTFIILGKGETVQDFLFSQRKGPVQFLLAEIPYQLTGDRRNELAQRLPYTIANVLGVVVAYKLVALLTASRLAALIVSVLFGINGFIVGFGRIAQYQSLNIVFSLTSLVFLYYLTKSKINLKKYAFLAGLFTSVSFLSHWDAIYYIPLAVFLAVKFLKRFDVTKQEKVKTVTVGLVAFLVPFLLFFIPYILAITTPGTGHFEYFGKRAGLEGSSLSEHLYIFLLYNPFVTQYFYLLGFLLSLFFIKKTWPYVVWFLIVLVLIKFLMITPKTHIYNYVIPLIFCCGLGFYHLFDFVYKKSRTFTGVIAVAVLLTTSFLYYQSYMLFVDHKPEYPWFEKKVWVFKTEEFYSDQVITFGFPYKRGWKEINSIVPPECKFLTNENKSIAQTYLDAKYGKSDKCQYIITVKHPFNLGGKDVIFAGLKKSDRVYQYRSYDRAVTSVYKTK